MNEIRPRIQPASRVRGFQYIHTQTLEGITYTNINKGAGRLATYT